MEQELSSKALEANLAETRVGEITIPINHQRFIDLSVSHGGIHKRTREFILEYHHPYSNRQFVIEHWREILLRDIWFYNSLEEAEDAFTILIDISKDLLHSDLQAPERGRIVQTLLEFIDSLSEQENIQERIINQCLDVLREYLAYYESVVIQNSRYFQSCLTRVVQFPQFSKEVFEIAKTVLQKSILFWESTSGIEDWFQQRKALFHRDYEQEISSIGEPFFSGLREQIGQAGKWQDLTQISSFSDIANRFRRSVDRFDMALERIYFVFYLLHLPGMANLQDSLLSDMNRLLKNVHNELSEDEVISFLENLLDLFDELKLEHMSILLDCFLTLGKEVIDTQNQNLIGLYEKKLIQFGFVKPGTVRINQDWQVQVDANHIKNIRTWLELIEYAPSMMRDLLSALIVNLRLGGVFISDTDLFQRDITKLLNSDIATLYKHVKQLCRIFPVYFSEIGCEGELRDLTTAIDELSQRHDRLLHFLRKQTHTESNSTHIELVRRIIRFWYAGELDPLRDSIPADVLESIDLGSEWFVPVNEIVRQLCEQRNCTPEELLDAGSEGLKASLLRVSTHNERDEKRIQYLARIYTLLREKYSFEVRDITSILRQYPFFDKADIESFADFDAAGDIENALKQIYRFMGDLNLVIQDTNYSEAWESIYHKRHIAAGIPSMYGQYREAKFEALGLTFRLERLASHLMEQLIRDINLDYVTAATLRRIHAVLTLFQEGLELDGIYNEGFNSNLKMLDFSLTSASFSLDQYVNIFQFIEQDIKEIINEYFLRIYDEPLRIIIPQLVEEQQGLSETEMRQISAKISEKFYREILSSAFLVQSLDNFISNTINALRNTLDNYSEDLIYKVMIYDPDLIISSLYEETPRMDNQVFLGAKAYFLKKLYSLGFPLPPGFVLTTELFRHKEVILKHPYINQEIDKFIQSHISKLEKITGQQFGNPKRPLLLSVRAGSAISMPGAMNTFLNVGMNDEIAEILSLQPNFNWTTWDCYRRFLQSWGMANGIERDVFDETILGFKSRYDVEHKVQFSPEQMREIAYEYKGALHRRGIHFEDDPFLQLKQAIFSVIDSWSSDRTKAYREHLQIAEEWGTAVIIQKMIFGNIDSRSGAGVLFTHDPYGGKPGISLYGDFTLRSQGEDIVAGLVHVLPITEYHRRKYYYDVDISLESAFPHIYQKLVYFSNELINKYGFGHQEIEFTFESDRPEDLYILQTRTQDIEKRDRRCVFTTPQDRMRLVGRGIGIGGGALSGIVAIDMDDLKLLSTKSPLEKCILIRPDTVPDDIGMVFECDGLLTGRGGATSHAAVTAVQLGKVCVVGCKDMVINEIEKTCTINGIKFKPGDKISIEGSLGNIYSGHYPMQYIEIS